MTQDQRPTKPTQQSPEKGNEIDPRQKEPIGPGGDRAGIDQPGAVTSKNPGHTNPSHNTPGHTRQDEPGQQELGQPGQAQTQSYPGVKGPKALNLQHDSDMDRKQVAQVEGGAETRVGNAQSGLKPHEATSSPLQPGDDSPGRVGKSKESRNDQ